MVLAGGLPYGGCLMDWFTTCLIFALEFSAILSGMFWGWRFPLLSPDCLGIPFAPFCFLSVRCCSLWFPLDALGSLGFHVVPLVPFASFLPCRHSAPHPLGENLRQCNNIGIWAHSSFLSEGLSANSQGRQPPTEEHTPTRHGLYASRCHGKAFDRYVAAAWNEFASA